MTASATIAHTSREIRTVRTVQVGDGEQRTIRVRPGRSNSRRDAIRASLGYGR
ncbi:hypothetical protein AB0L22_09320 [Micromonospora haikouensis]|uniref:hypothetical protein n=1 Tax=Micromonospora haikouensis TaxID=686309 RepID=UPI00344838AB